MSETETKLMLALRDLLGDAAAGAGAETSFSELGMDSLAGLRFARRAEEATGHPIDPEWLYDHPSVAALARQLDRLQASVNPSVG